MRWIVETRPDSFTTIAADVLEIHKSGSLVFKDYAERDGEPTLAISYAPHAWVTVCPEDGAA